MPQEKAGLSIVAVVHPISHLNPARVPGDGSINLVGEPERGGVGADTRKRNAASTAGLKSTQEERAGKAGMKEDEVVLVDDGACPKG
jgi:hypothetical protein